MKVTILTIVFAISSVAIFGQGGKAEPKRIEFPNGQNKVTLRGTISNAQEMEYVFSAKKGQKVTVTSGSAKLFDFRIFNADLDFETEFESSATASYVLPGSGDFMFFVRKKIVRTPRTARFTYTITIK